MFAKTNCPSSLLMALLSLAATGCGISDAGLKEGTDSESASSPSNGATFTATSLTAYNLTGFATQGSGTTGGGVIAETDAAYRKCYTALDLANAVHDANKTAGAVKVIEIMNDLNLGWNEVGSDVQTLSSTPFRAHNAPKLHPALITSGVSVIDVKAKGGGLTIFSAAATGT